MKRLLLILALLLMVVGVQGLALDFQNPSDFSAQVTCDAASCSWAQNSIGGNSYVYVTCLGGFDVCGLRSQTSLLTTYSAATFIYGDGLGVILKDSALNTIYYYSVTGTVGTRYEMKMIGGKANIYKNGILAAQSDAINNPAYVTYNPYRWSGGGGGTWTNGGVDDVIWGSTESRYIFGMPESGYFLQKDILNPAASGF